MTWTRRSLRALGALGLALLLYAATPHVHLTPHSTLHDARIAGTTESTRGSDGASRATAALSSDDAHESHRLTQTGDAHPCTLCRNGTERIEASVAPTAFRLALAPAARLEAPRLETWPARPLARRHAARAPPAA